MLTTKVVDDAHMVFLPGKGVKIGRCRITPANKSLFNGKKPQTKENIMTEATLNAPKVSNGEFTIVSKATGDHRTFKVHTARKGPLKDKRILSLFRGCENTDSSQYQGFAFVADNGIKIWGRFKNKPEYAIYARMIWEFSTDPKSHWLEKADFKLSKHCRRCNRLLTNPDSIDHEYGPECVKLILRGE